MGLECDGYPFKVDMKIFTPESMGGASSGHSNARRRRKTREPSGGEMPGRDTSGVAVGYSHEVQEIGEDGEVIPGQIVLHPLRPRVTVTDPDSRFLSHFLGTVSKLLIVYDVPYNVNPYRSVFPKLAASSGPLQEAMHALGALHLSQTTDEALRAGALQKYNSTVTSLRRTLMNDTKPRLAHLATILLLAFYEMMDSGSTSGWLLHLKGARDVFERLFSASTGAAADDPNFTLAKDFLISCLTYLDMAAAVSTAQPTLIRGDYWQKVGGGWQYNLGVPSAGAQSPSEGRLEMLRQTWSQLMLIQSDVGGLNAAIERGALSAAQSRRNDLEGRFADWQRTLPDIYHDMVGLEADVVEGASCVLAYAAATFVYFHQICGSPFQVLTDTLPNILIAPEICPGMTLDERISAAIAYILANFERFGKGSNGFGMLWAFFVAGTALEDAARQSYVDGKLGDMTAFGFGNVERARELLQIVWRRRAQNRNRLGLPIELSGLLEDRWWKVQEELGRPIFLP
ncbi:hypothetical protein PYCC9005_004601 [Savitreella phatthalungensis]